MERHRLADWTHAADHCGRDGIGPYGVVEEPSALLDDDPRADVDGIEDLEGGAGRIAPREREGGPMDTELRVGNPRENLDPRALILGCLEGGVSRLDASGVAGAK